MQNKIKFLPFFIVWVWGVTTTIFESQANCYRNTCPTYQGFMKCLASSASPYAPFVHRPDQVSTPESFQAFQYFMTRHGHCYTNFCNAVCAEYSEDVLEQKQTARFSRFNATKYEGRVQAIKNFCTQKNTNAEQFKFLCSFCTPYLKNGNSIIEECAYKRKDPVVKQPTAATVAPPREYGRNPSVQRKGGYSADKFERRKMVQFYEVSDSASAKASSDHSEPSRKREEASESRRPYGNSTYNASEYDNRSPKKNMKQPRNQPNDNFDDILDEGMESDSASSASSFSAIE